MKKILLILSTLALVACKLDDNIDPNLPRTEDLSPTDLITAAETTSYAAQTGSACPVFASRYEKFQVRCLMPAPD